MHVSAVTQVVRGCLVAALAAFALVAFTPSGADAASAGAACRRSFTNGTDQAITNQAAILSEINVPKEGLVVADVDVEVNINHTGPEDLEIFLRSDNEDTGSLRITQLFKREGATVGDNLRGTIFDDEAPISIAWGNGPFTGRFTPTRPLAAHDGDIGGSYSLLINDTFPTDNGTLDNWSVVLTYASCDFDADGVEDHADQCLDLTARTATGCPPTSRAVTAQYKAGKFRGALSSPVAGCAAGREVTVFRNRPGPDRRVGAVITGADGSFRLARAKKRGRYYAVSLPAVVADAAECPAVQSRTFRIR
jgi:subtilisin-like proprotein convertase family protein